VYQASPSKLDGDALGLEMSTADSIPFPCQFQFQSRIIQHGLPPTYHWQGGEARRSAVCAKRLQMDSIHLASGMCRRSCCLLEHAISTASPRREGQVGEQEIE